MNRESAEDEILRIVREELLLGSDRPIPLDAPLGELGVGLDSLALVKLLTAVEATFGVDVPDDVWTARGPLSVETLAGIVASAPRRVEPARAGEEPKLVRGRMERAEQALAGGGIGRRAVWTGMRLLAPVKQFTFGFSRTYVLERRLDGLSGGPAQAPPGIVLRSYASEDEDGLSGLWPRFAERHGRRFLRRMLREGAIALIAADDGRIVALDLVSGKGEDEVRIEQPGASFGFWLTEAPDARGRGIGLALVDYSLGVARERGFRTQLTWVDEDNTAMLAAATQLLGFSAVGTASRLHVLGFTRWSWDVHGRSGRGRKLVL
ncbi:MAG TPA: GNAT family N-acetyltransferase [Gaiellaceae bacterium]|nr:GNAT family N-acetyltransferase [Gaiellaceae bacterium]